MCGLAGMFGDIYAPDEKVFRELLFGASLRGKHSTGVGFATFNGDMSYIKSAVPSPEFLEFKELAKRFNSIGQYNVVMGHARHATQGKVNEANAHPFIYGDMLFCHNGTLWTTKQFENDKDFDVDSEEAAYCLSQKGADFLIQNSDGAYCYNWYDAKENTFNLIRNDERPLWIAKCNSRHHWFYTSEGGLLEWILSRNKRDYELFELKTDTLFTCFMDDYTVSQRPLSSDTTYSTKTSYYPGYGTLYSANDDDDATIPSFTTQGDLDAPTAVEHTPLFQTQNERRSKGNHFLDVHGLKKGNSIIRFFATDFFRYSPQGPNGRIEGCFISPNAYDDDIVTVEGNGVSWDSVSIVQDGSEKFHSDYYAGVISSCVYDDAKGLYTLYVLPDLIQVKQDEINQYTEVLIDPAFLQSPTAPPFLNAKHRDVAPPFQDFGNQKELKDRVLGPRGVYVSPERFTKLTENGCSYCTNNIWPEDADRIDWIDDEQPICATCIKHFCEGTGPFKDSNIGMY